MGGLPQALQVTVRQTAGKHSGKDATVVQMAMLTDHERSVRSEARSDIPASLHSAQLSRELFGGKAEQIAVSASLGLRVPAGYAISSDLAAKIIHGSAAHRRTIVEPIFNELAAESPSGTVIVRSSHPAEAGADMRLSGFFKSVGGNRSVSALLRAIDRVAAEAVNLDGFEGDALPLVLQSEIPVEASAIVWLKGRTARVDLFRGGLSEPIRGMREPTVVVLIKSSAAGLSCRILADAEGFGAGAKSLTRTLVDALPVEGQQVLYEAGFDGAAWHIFQRQEIGSGAAGDGPTWGGVGRKAAAMATFKDLGLFSKRLQIFRPGEDIELQSSEWRFPLTIRFSCEEMLGLPRAFVTDPSELQEFLKLRSAGWSTIIHDFIDVARSFELLIDEDRAYLEHVPGLWESDNPLSPDALLIEADGRCRGFYAKVSRICRSGLEPGEADLVVPSIGPRELREWAERLSELLPALRVEFADQLPANFHFVEDAAGNWNFLNCRPAHHPPQLTGFARLHAHPVETTEDLSAWDGRSPILLRVRTARGREQELVPLATCLANLKVPIYAQFGYLSHPAMVLLAHGVKLAPACYDGSSAEGRLLSQTNFTLDSGLDPLDRILAEEAVFVDENVRIVRDRDPIAPNHLLVLSREPLKGFADGLPVSSAALEALQRHPSLAGGPLDDWFVYERGRASFCTSGFTDVHAHMHMLPLSAFAPGLLNELAANVGAEPCADLHAAWRRAAGEAGEYLIFGRATGPAFLRLGGTAPLGKRFVRRFLTERLV
jgi:diadenosine tetraphosphate (Ap4A) HIT family hydrolase